MGNKLEDICNGQNRHIVGFDNEILSITKQSAILAPQRSKIVQSTYLQLIRQKSIDYTLQHQKNSFHPIKLNIFEEDGVYLGWIRNDKPHGPGQLYFNNQSYLQAIFKQGEVDCEDALFIQMNGDYYRGSFKNSKQHGMGILKTNKDVIKAQFQNGYASGKGQKYFEDGSIYKGQFKNGIMQGKGILVYPNNEIYQGIFRYNKPNGIGKFKGQKYQYFGPFKDGLKEGKGTMILKDQTKFQGWFSNNKIDGYGQWHRSNGIIQKGVYSLELQH